MAVVLPMVLDSEPKSVNQNVDIQIPPPDSPEFKPKAAAPAASGAEGGIGKPTGAPLKSDTAASAPSTEQAPSVAKDASGVGSPKAAPATPPSASIADPGPSTAAVGARAEGAEAKSSAADGTKDTATARTDSKDLGKTGAKEPAGSASAAYVVQVAALADAAKVKQLQKQMAGAGVKTYTEVVATKSGEVTRVRAGPYATREAAEKARTQLKKAGLDGKVVPK